MAYLSSFLSHRLRMVKEELVRASNTMEEQRAFNRNILQNMGNGLITINPEGKITSSNPAALALAGYSIEESLENPIGQLIPLVELKNLISGDKILDLPKQIEGEYQRKDGRIIFIRIKKVILPTSMHQDTFLYLKILPKSKKCKRQII